MHVEAQTANHRPSTMRVSTWNPWTGTETVEVPTTLFDLVGRDGKPLPLLRDGDSVSFAVNVTYE